MSNSHYFIESVETGENLGSIEDRARKIKKDTTTMVEELYELNRCGTVNFRTKNGKYIHGIKLNFKEKKLNIYNISVFLPNEGNLNVKLLFTYLIIYLFQPIILTLMVWIYPITLLLVPFDQFIILFIIFTLMILNIFFHELGHYISCCYFKIPCIIQIRGLYNSILFKTENNKEIIVVSLTGIIVTILIFVKITIFATLLEPSLLKSIIVTSSVLMLIIFLLFLPKTTDYQNIRRSISNLKEIKKQKGGDQK